MKIAIASNSAPIHGKNIAEVCNKHTKHDFTYLEYDGLYDTGYELYDITDYDVLLNLGYFVPIGIWTETIRKAEPDMPIINCWIGSDILQNLGHYHSGQKQHVNAAKHYINIADSPMFVEELKDFFGIDAKLIKTCPSRMLEVRDLPNIPQMLTYMPYYRRTFYNFEMMMEIASLNTDTNFAIVAHPEPKQTNLPNAKWYPLLNKDALAEVIYETTGIIRMPLHDGYSITLLECLSAGRYAITNTPDIPHTIYAPSMITAGKAVRKIRTKLEPNYEAAEWVREHFAPHHMAESIDAVLREI